MMHDIEIQHEEWWSFCESFSQAHRGRPVGLIQCPTESVQHATASTPALLFAGQRQFQEVRGAQGANDVVELMVTVWEGTEEMSYLIKDAVALYNRGSGERCAGLRIDCRDGTTTLLELRATAPGDGDGAMIG